MFEKIKKWAIVILVVLIILGTCLFIFAVPGFYNFVERTFKRLFSGSKKDSIGGTRDSSEVARLETINQDNGRKLDDTIKRIDQTARDIEQTNSSIADGNKDLTDLADGLRAIADEPNESVKK